MIYLYFILNFLDMNIEEYEVIIVGAGLSGIVIAEQFSSKLNKKVLIIDKRDHIGGNCYDYVDHETGILINKYGAHLFHTNNEEVFKYINKFSEWIRWEHTVVGLINNQYIPIPVNITTINKLLNLNIKNEEEMSNWLKENQVKFEKINNGEEMAKSRVGEEIYEKIFKHYTYKQWNKYPEDLLPETLARIPIRKSFDNRYFTDKYQVLPKNGYTKFFESILNNNKNNIDVKLNTDFLQIKDLIDPSKIIIYTGPIDTYFQNKGLPRLEYRSINFEIERKMNTNFYQPNSVVNYPEKEIQYTRCVEYKHFLNQKSNHTVYVKETSTDKGEPYYPVLNEKNIKLYKKYQELTKDESNIHFIGRLASYKYFNMDQAIENSLNYFKSHFQIKITKSNNFLNKNESFIVYKKNGFLNFIDNGGNQTRNESVIWNIIEADKIYNWCDFSKIKINTHDFLCPENECSFIGNYKNNNSGINNIIPDFVFHKWTEVGVDNYKTFTEKIDKAGRNKSTSDKLGWIGNLNTYITRKKLYQIGQDNESIMEIISMEWIENNNKGKLLKATTYMSMIELVSKYKYLIDIRGFGNYSARLKILLWSHRPILIVEREGKEFFEFNLIPWTHFIPVKADLSDIIEKLNWCIKNENYANKIAENAYQFSIKNLTQTACFSRWNDVINNFIDKDNLKNNKDNNKIKIRKIVNTCDNKIYNQNNSKYMNLKIFYFYIRGHIRNSFKTDRLKNFIFILKKNFPNIKFILQTWKTQECKKNESWRNIEENNNIITQQKLEDYFEDKNITKNTIIIDENTIELIGYTDGKICSSDAPKKGWKNMWYGIYKGLENKNFYNKMLVSFRFDYFDIEQSDEISELEIFEFINNNLYTKNIKFLQNNVVGVDNLYIGPSNKILSLIKKFHFELDEILNSNEDVIHQEFLVDIVAKKLDE